LSSEKYSFLSRPLETRKSEGNLRKLDTVTGLSDFSSNDYLGLSRDLALSEKIMERALREGPLANGGTGSRLLSGNHRHYVALEKKLATLFQAEGSLVFNSGYAANQALIAAVAQKGDTILYDQLAHVCIKEGAWLSKADSFSYLHNNLADLERRLIHAQGNVFVVTETVFSMDGDFAPIDETLSLCEKYGAHLIVDEAHSTGVYGHGGSGWLVQEALHDRVFARVYTFGKAMGVHGACVSGSQRLIDYLVNFARGFIYTTSLPPHSILSIDEAFNYLADHSELPEKLHQNIAFFRSQVAGAGSQTSIQPIMVAGNDQAKATANALKEKGLDVRPILSPTVKRGTERLRISLHAHNTHSEIRQLCNALEQMG